MSSDSNTNIEKDTKETKKSEYFSEFFGFDKIVSYDTEIKDKLDEMNLGKREINAMVNEIQKTFITLNKLSNDINGYIVEKDLSTSFEKVISNLEKKSKNKKTSEKKSEDDEESDEKKNTTYAVHKTAKCYDFINEFMAIDDKDFKPNENNEYSQVEIRNAMNAFVNKEKEKNPDKISKGMPDGRSFRVYGPLKELITKIIEGPLKEDISLIEKIINEKKAENPEADSKEHKVIDYMTQWIESKKKYLEVPEILQYTGLMTFSNLCFIERDTIRKASKKPKDDEKKK